MRTESVLGVALRFVQAKSRLKPIKAAITIPHMELLAAKMGLALAKKLVPALNVRHQAIWLWTDSRAVHNWLRVELGALQVFVKKQGIKNTTIPKANTGSLGARTNEPGGRSSKRDYGHQAERNKRVV
jgi:ribonuclease HI